MPYEYSYMIFNKDMKNMHQREGGIFIKWCLEKRVSMIKNETTSLPLTKNKNQFRWIEDLRIRLEIPKPLEEKVENSPQLVGTDNDFLYRTPVVQKIR